MLEFYALKLTSKLMHNNHQCIHFIITEQSFSGAETLKFRPQKALYTMWCHIHSLVENTPLKYFLLTVTAQQCCQNCFQSLHSMISILKFSQNDLLFVHRSQQGEISFLVASYRFKFNLSKIILFLKKQSILCTVIYTDLFVHILIKQKMNGILGRPI